MSDQNTLQTIYQKIKTMKANAVESQKMYPKRYRDAQQLETTKITTLNGVLKIFDDVIFEKNGEGEDGGKRSGG